MKLLLIYSALCWETFKRTNSSMISKHHRVAPLKICPLYNKHPVFEQNFVLVILHESAKMRTSNVVYITSKQLGACTSVKYIAQLVQQNFIKARSLGKLVKKRKDAAALAATTSNVVSCKAAKYPPKR